MRVAESQIDSRGLTGTQAAQLLRDGRLGSVLIERAAKQVTRHRCASADQANALRRAVCAHSDADRHSDGAAA